MLNTVDLAFKVGMTICSRLTNSYKLSQSLVKSCLHQMLSEIPKNVVCLQISIYFLPTKCQSQKKLNTSLRKNANSNDVLL